MYSIIVTEPAQEDLDEILTYLIDSLANVAAASSLLDDVEKCYQELKFMPAMFGQCSDRRLRELGYRRAVIKNYIMVYQIDADHATVYILRFFYGPRDYERLI